MNKVSHIASIIFKSVTLALIILGTVLAIVTTPYKGEVFCYYTAQCNLLCAMLLAVLLVFEFFGGMRKNHYYYIFKFGLTMCALLSLAVYTPLLTPTERLTLGGGFTGILNHAVIPALLLADYLIFDEKGHLPWYAPLLCGIGPLAHGGFVLVRTLSGEKYHVQEGALPAPYAFLRGDVTDIIVNLIWLILGFLVVCQGVALLDFGYSVLKRKKEEP